MQKTCDHCAAAFEISNEDLELLDTLSPTFAGKKFSIPAPTLCPTCRLRRRMSFRNERSLYRRVSDLSGKIIISTFAPELPFKVYDQDEWWSDAWDPLTYGKNFDPTQLFSKQLFELNISVPHPSLNTTNVENSTYTNYSLNVKNSYLVFGVTNAEDCLYGKFIMGSKDIVDSLSLYSCERCYEGIASRSCYNCMFFSYAENCSDSAFIEDCMSCKNCLLCFGLRNKEYCIFNEQLDRETFESRRKELLTELTVTKIARLQEMFVEFTLKLPHRASHISGSEDCTGDMVSQSKGCKECFDVTKCEDCRFTAFTPNGVSSSDCCFTAPEGVQWSYEGISTLGERCMGTYMCWHCTDTYYSIDCRSCRHVFGCIGLKNKQYCVFNKEYSKEEYETLISRIAEHMVRTGEWGEFLPVSLSHFAYNETIAHEYFPLIKEQALVLGWQWRDKDDQPQEGTPLSASKLPRTIGETTDEIMNDVIQCELTERPYKIVKQELAFYRAMGLPIPHTHPDERHKDRLRRKNPYRLWQRSCTKCDAAIASNYAPERKEIIVCEACYLKEIY